jgi:four helix bundle protein
MGKFQDLKVWQRSKELAVFLYRATSGGAFSKDWGLRDQIRRAVISIASNIAEGEDLDTDRQAVKFFYMARGSAAEVLTQCIIAYEIGYLTKDDFDHLAKECRTISAMLIKLIHVRSNTNKGQGTQRPVQGQKP